MKQLTAKLKQVLSELARDNGGEMLSTRQKARMLGDLPPAIETTPSRREVVLAIGNMLPPAAMRYAISVCQRMDAALYVLAEDIATANVMLDPWRKEREAAGVSCCIEAIGSSARLNSFFAAHPRTAFAIAGGHGDLLTQAFGGSTLTRRKSPVPIVVVDDSQAGATVSHARAANDMALRYAMAD